MDLSKYVVSFIGSHALEERKRELLLVQVVIDQDKLESLPLESATFERVVGDDTISEILDEAVHPTRDVLDLMDF